MCLHIRQSPAPTTNLTVYKVYSKETYDRTNIFRSPYRTNIAALKKGQFVKSNRRTVKINKVERKYGEINHGLHCFVTKHGARNMAQGYGASAVIAEMEGKPEDFVSFGGRRDSKRITQAVFTRLKFKRLVTRR